MNILVMMEANQEVLVAIQDLITKEEQVGKELSLVDLEVNSHLELQEGQEASLEGKVVNFHLELLEDQVAFLEDKVVNFHLELLEDQVAFPEDKVVNFQVVQLEGPVVSQAGQEDSFQEGFRVVKVVLEDRVDFLELNAQEESVPMKMAMMDHMTREITLLFLVSQVLTIQFTQRFPKHLSDAISNSFLAITLT